MALLGSNGRTKWRNVWLADGGAEHYSDSADFEGLLKLALTQCDFGYWLLGNNLPRCARAWPQELGHWFGSQNLQLSSGIAQSWAWALEKSLMRPSILLVMYFQVWEIRKKRSHWPGSQPAPRLYNRYNLCPCARPAHVGECWPGP